MGLRAKSFWVLQLLIVLLAGTIYAGPGGQEARARRFPAVSELPPQRNFPDPLVMLDGRRVTTREQWYQRAPA